jgi:hypothetical protein
VEAALVLSEVNWRALLSQISSGGKYVSLDLAACTSSTSNVLGGLRANGDFDPMPSIDTGKDKIVSLTLPGQASGIVAGSTGLATFGNFSALKTISGAGIRTIGEYAFISSYYYSLALTSVSFPVAETIGGGAFHDNGLTSVSLPAAVTIGDSAFSNNGLTSVSLPAAVTIGGGAFANNGLTSVSLPAAKTIGDFAFNGCRALTSITLGTTPPTLGYRILDNVEGSILVKIPSGSQTAYDVSGYSNSARDNVNWGNGFRGRGWNGTSCIIRDTNPYVKLFFITY